MNNLLTCSCCGRVEKVSILQAIEKECCTECYLWLYNTDFSSDNSFVSYRVGDKQPNLYSISNNKLSIDKGHGGDYFKINKYNQESVISNNVWHRGEIPERFRYLISKSLTADLYRSPKRLKEDFQWIKEGQASVEKN